MKGQSCVHQFLFVSASLPVFLLDTLPWAHLLHGRWLLSHYNQYYKISIIGHLQLYILHLTITMCQTKFNSMSKRLFFFCFAILSTMAEKGAIASMAIRALFFLLVQIIHPTSVKFSYVWRIELWSWTITPAAWELRVSDRHASIQKSALTWDYKLCHRSRTAAVGAEGYVAACNAILGSWL